MINRHDIPTYIASGGAVFFGFTANEFAAIGGLVIAVLTFIVNLAFKWEERKERKCILKMEQDRHKKEGE